VCLRAELAPTNQKRGDQGLRCSVIEPLPMWFQGQPSSLCLCQYCSLAVGEMSANFTFEQIATSAGVSHWTNLARVF
jgi:hypothetical protein